MGGKSASRLPRISQFPAALDELSTALAELSETNEKLAARVQALDEKINKDSHNSNKPPSSDGLAWRFSRERQSSAKKPGGQKGHEGATLAMLKHPQHVKIHQVKSCHGCVNFSPIVVEVTT